MKCGKDCGGCGGRCVIPAFILFSLLLALLCAVGNLLVRYMTEQAGLPASASAAAPRPVIVTDPGHGGEDGGTSSVTGSGTREKDLNLAVCGQLSALLRFAGAEVIQTRTEDVLLYDRQAEYRGRKKALDQRERLRVAADSGCALFVSIHMNYFPDGRYSGLQVWYSPNDPRSQSAARKLQEAVRSALQPGNEREVKPSAGGIYLLDRLSCPAVLVECGFLSNEEECRLLESAGYRQRLCAVLAAAVTEGLYDGTLD